MQPHKDQRNGDVSSGASSIGNGGAHGANSAPSVEDDCDEEPPAELTFDNPDLVPATLAALNMMRKNRHFCDVVLQAPGGVEVAAHRAVIAAASPYLFELFTADHDRGPATLPLSYKLDGACDKTSLKALVEYAYTGKLRVGVNSLRSVQQCAWQLRMDTVARGCGDALAAQPTLDSCLAVRSLPGLSPQQRIDLNNFIAENFTLLYTSSALSALPAIKLEILENYVVTDHRKLPTMALTWLQDTLTNDDITLSDLCSRPHLLYIHDTGIVDSLEGISIPHSTTLRDAARLPPANEDTPMLQDYKRMASMQIKNAKRQLTSSQSTGQIVSHASPANGSNGATPTNGNGARSRGTFYSHHIAERFQTDFDWTIIASDKVDENVWLSVASLGEFGCAAVSVVVSAAPLADCLVTSAPLSASPVQLAPLDRPRSAHGAAQLNGKLIVCGGYDRLECLKSCEKYDPLTNTWSSMPDMKQPRGRFSIAQIENRLYAVGGSDGHNELDTMEMYEDLSEVSGQVSSSVSRSMTASIESQSDLSASEDNGENVGHVNHNGVVNGKQSLEKDSKGKSGKGWKSRSRLPLARSHVAVCGEGRRLFCLGGWTGQRGVRACHAYLVDQDTWTDMPSLNTGRYQTAAVVWQGALWSLGGCDTWHCLNTTEVIPLDQIDSEDGKWTTGPELSVARRGCAGAEFRGRLFVLGGSDGSSSLRSVECLSSLFGSWTLASPLREKRAAPSATVICNRLYVVGGFSGKKFLSSMEYLSDLDGEWTTIVSPIVIQLAPVKLCLPLNGGLTDEEKERVTINAEANSIASEPEERTRSSNRTEQEPNGEQAEGFLHGSDSALQQLSTVS